MILIQLFKLIKVEFQFYLLIFSDVIQAIILYTVGLFQQSVVGRICGRWAQVKINNTTTDGLIQTNDG